MAERVACGLAEDLRKSNFKTGACIARTRLMADLAEASRPDFIHGIQSTWVNVRCDMDLKL